MKPFNSVLLCLVYALFLSFGGLIFRYMEYEIVETIEVIEPPEWKRLKDLALNDDPPEDEDVINSLARWLDRACPHLSDVTVNALVKHGSQKESVKQVEFTCPHLHFENVTTDTQYIWTFFDALFFSMTVTTTIGYGHIVPSGAWARVVCIMYSVVGIPLTGILLAWTSSFFGDKLLLLFKSRLTEQHQESHSFIAAATIIYIGLGFIVFIFIPAGFLTYLEGWTYVDSVYYSYITLTTIGFGDLVPGSKYEGVSQAMYQIGVILWIMIGLGYWVMVANFITKALNSKRLKSSVKRSAEEMKKLMHQMGLKNHDPAFLTQHSKATVNFMLQLSNILAVHDTENRGEGRGDSTKPGTTSTNSPGHIPSTSASPTTTITPGGIPGISALFGAGLGRTMPLSHLMGPLKKEFNMSFHTPNNSRRATMDYSGRDLPKGLYHLQGARDNKGFHDDDL